MDACARQPRAVESALASLLDSIYPRAFACQPVNPPAQVISLVPLLRHPRFGSAPAVIVRCGLGPVEVRLGAVHGSNARAKSRLAFRVQAWPVFPRSIFTFKCNDRYI
jgi:hypothetical protein